MQYNCIIFFSSGPDGMFRFCILGSFFFVVVLCILLRSIYIYSVVTIIGPPVMLDRYVKFTRSM